MRPSRICTSGFTLLELVVIVSLVGIVTAMALPRLTTANHSADAAMHSVGTTLMAAHRDAVTRQHNVVIAFDAERSALRIHEDVNDNRTVDAGEHVRYVQLPEMVEFARGSAPALEVNGVALDGPISFGLRQDGMPAVVFGRAGSASEQGVVYVSPVNGHKGSVRAVMITRSTGRVSWHTYSGGAWREGF